MYSLWNLTSWNINVVSGVTYFTPHNIVSVVWLWHLVTGIYTNLNQKGKTGWVWGTWYWIFLKCNKSLIWLAVINLEDVVSRFHISNIYPLAVDVGIVSVIAPGTQALEIQKQYTFRTRTCKLGMEAQCKNQAISIIQHLLKVPWYYHIIPSLDHATVCQCQTYFIKVTLFLQYLHNIDSKDCF